MTTAFVLSGGGSLGAVQVGMLQALTERDITPDLLVGTSAGALNAVFLASHSTGRSALDELAQHWAGVRRRDVFPLAPPWRLLARSGSRNALCSDRGLRKLITGHLLFDRLEDAPIPVHVVATDLLSGEEVLLSSGDALSAVLASTAIPGVLPPVRRAGLTLVDGGLADNTAISQAVELGAGRVFVLPTGYACALPEAPTGPLGVALQAISLLIEQRLIADLALYGDLVDLTVIPPLCPLAISAIDFGHSASLMQRAYHSAAAWLDTGGGSRPHQERFLSMHGH